MSSSDFAGRTALVTGGASGIGAATAARLRASGAEVAVFDREPVEGYVSVTGDISSSADVNAAVEQVERDLGRIDVLVNSAGVPGESLRTVDVGDEEWQRVFAINANGSFYMCRAVLPGMIERGYGRIVLVASIAGKEGNPMAAAYSASKAAVASLTKSLAVEWAQSGVNVNAIAPGVFRTKLNEHLLDGTERGREFLMRTPMGRFGNVEELAGAAVFLASDASSFVTGEIIAVDGGFLASGVNK